jgi:hypothetical protein
MFVFGVGAEIPESTIQERQRSKADIAPTKMPADTLPSAHTFGVALRYWDVRGVYGDSHVASWRFGSALDFDTGCSGFSEPIVCCIGSNGGRSG